MTEHTKEPWRVATDGPNSAYRWRDTVLVEAPVTGQAVPDIVCELYRPGDANARRIVACVNACAGIDTVELEIIIRRTLSAEARLTALAIAAKATAAI